MEKKQVGETGETLACQFLERKGYEILTRNYRRPWGEIDIVARASDRTLVFVEVKALRQAQGKLCDSDQGIGSLLPEDHLTHRKMERLKKICQSFCAANPKFLDEKKGWRIDLVAIELPQGNLTLDDKNVVIRHYEKI